MPEHRITYIVAVKNMARTIDKCLSSVLSQKPYEVIVVDAHSTNGTTQIVSKYPVKHHFDPGHSPSHARNLALTLATGDYVVIVDGDQWLPLNFEETLKNVITKEWPDIIRYQEMVHCKNYWSRCYLIERLISSFILQALGFNFPTPFSPSDESNVRIIRRSRLIEVGGWDSKLISFEDTDLWLRLLYLPNLRFSKCNNEPCPIIFSDESDLNPLLEFKRGIFYGCGMLRFMKKHRKFNQAFLFPPLNFIFSLSIFVALFASSSLRFAFGAFLLRMIRSLGYALGVIKSLTLTHINRGL